MSAADPRASAEHIVRAALAAVDARDAVRRALRRSGDALLIAGEEAIDLASVRRVLAVGAGKAAAGMAAGLRDVLGDRLDAGTITTQHRHALPVPGWEVWEAGHPLPDAGGLAGAAAALRVARDAGVDDLLLCLLSGGASALWPAPPSGITLADIQAVTGALLRAGAPIEELNAVRKHLGRIGGGALARAAAPARLVALVISDVVGDRLDVIASGPTVPDPTTYAEALEVLRGRCGSGHGAARTYLAAGAAGMLPETPKPGDDAFARASAHVVARNRDALDAAVRAAWSAGYAAEIVDDRMRGEAREVGARVAARALEARTGGVATALLWGGETTVTVRGDGTGGRNQELALAAALALAGQVGIVVAALGTDGTDGPTHAAGGMVDGGTVARARAAGLDAADHLARNDSLPLLRASGDLWVTGPTGTNVGDAIVALVG